MTKVSFFNNAQPVKKSGKKTDDINKLRKPTNGLLMLASIDAVLKSLEILKDEATAVVKDQMRDTFVSRGVALGHRPENYVGIDGAASASLELRKRSERSALDEGQAEALRDEGISLLEEMTYSLNQEVLTPAVMALVEKALNKVPGIPANLFTASCKVTVADAALDEVFTKGTDKAKVLLDVVGVLVTKPKLEEDFEKTLKRVVKLLA